MAQDQALGGGARRARWLADLAAALEEAARLAANLGDDPHERAIREHIAAVRREVELARMSRFSGAEHKSPKRTESAQWRGQNPSEQRR